MTVTIEYTFCPYCEEVTELYFRIIDTILYASDETELRNRMERLKQTSPIDEYFTYDFGENNFWVYQRRPSDRSKVFGYHIIMAAFQ